MEIPLQPDHVLTCEEIGWMTSPLVYIRRRVHDGKALYVGATSGGLIRPLDSSHEKAKPENGETLEVYLAEKPFELEAILIRREQPLFNTVISEKGKRYFNHQCKYCEKPFQSKHGKALYCSPVCRFKAWDQKHPRVRTP